MNLLQGTLDLLVMKALVFGPRHGYEVARWVRETTEGTLEVDDGALYTSLHRMEKRGWVEAEWGQSEKNHRARFYKLTPAGRKRLKQEVADFERVLEAILRVVQPAGGA